MNNGLMPIGSVVLLKGAEKRLMIVGVCRMEEKDGKQLIWDYAGCYYPEGYIDENKVFLFNNDMIDTVYAIGFQDEEQFEFEIKADALIAEAREKYNSMSE